MLPFLVFVSQNSRLVTPLFEFCPVSLFLATLKSFVEANPSVCHSYKKHRGWGSLRLPLVTSDQSPVTKSFTFRTYEKRACNSFGIRTSKTRHLKPFRIRTYKKRRGRGCVVNQLSDENGCPEEHRDEGSLRPSDEEFLSRTANGS
jgi:hypothetical protein